LRLGLGCVRLDLDGCGLIIPLDRPGEVGPMFRQRGFELFENVFSQAGLSAKLGEPTDDCALRGDVSLTLRDVVADQLDLARRTHAASYA